MIKHRFKKLRLNRTIKNNHCMKEPLPEGGGFFVSGGMELTNLVSLS